MQTLPICLNKTWKLVISTEANDDDNCDMHEWIVADLVREKQHFTLDCMHCNEGKGDAIDIVNIAEGDDVVEVLHALDDFQNRWLRYALELGIQFEIEDYVKEWAEDLRKNF